MFDKEPILQLASEYFGVLHSGDVDTAERIFHHDCNLFNVLNGTIQSMPMAKYLDVLRTRETPMSRGEPLFGEVILLDQLDQDTVCLKVRSAVQPRYFEDYLTLLRENGCWKIVSKVYRVVT